jgi:hypothetical protein
MHVTQRGCALCVHFVHLKTPPEMYGKKPLLRTCTLSSRTHCSEHVPAKTAGWLLLPTILIVFVPATLLLMRFSWYQALTAKESETPHLVVSSTENIGQMRVKKGFPHLCACGLVSEVPMREQTPRGIQGRHPLPCVSHNFLLLVAAFI